MQSLLFYKKKEFRELMVENAKNREVVFRFGEGFGKRPDSLKYPEEILELIKNKVSSFHASEELWSNPSLINSNMKKKDMDKLRIGWDLILDIDSPYWKIAKITAWLILNGLRDHGINSVSIKFSGNKGFHIGVPFEAFPKIFNGKNTKELFPEAPRSIAKYLIKYITKKYIKVEGNSDIIFGDGLNKKFRISISKLKDLTNLEITSKICSKCSKKIDSKAEDSLTEFQCIKCGIEYKKDLDYFKCPNCNILTRKIGLNKTLCICGSDEYTTEFNPLSIIEVDTLLISSRHLFRMPYSFHEKSKLISIPFNPNKILLFERKFAKPEIVKPSKNIFLDKKNVKPGEAKKLLEEAMAHSIQTEKKEIREDKYFELIEDAIPEKFFPPCINNIIKGLTDGKKRSIFILINYLKCIGWNHDMIEEKVLEFNKNNPEPLKETIIRGQLRYHKQNKERILPPNCTNKAYYIDMHICTPDNFCKRIKNPANYSILKSRK